MPRYLRMLFAVLASLHSIIRYPTLPLLSLSGTGTFGRVCLCRDRISEKYCAMKILAMTEVIRLKQIEHVKNERNILREIRHPFVISL